MARIKQKKENDENEKEYKKKLQEVNERLLEMQEIEVDLIRYGGGVKKLDPVQSQYQALITSVRNLCNDANIAETILDHLQATYDQICERKAGNEGDAAQEPYSAALEVILWSTRHILQMDELDINTTERSFLIAKIN